MRTVKTIAVGFVVALVLLATGMDVAGQSPYQSSDDFARDAMKLREKTLLKIEPQVIVSNTNRPGFFAGRYPWKVNIVTEVFWIGEPGSGTGSAWDPEWACTPAAREENLRTPTPTHHEHEANWKISIEHP